MHIYYISGLVLYWEDFVLVLVQGSAMAAPQVMGYVVWLVLVLDL